MRAVTLRRSIRAAIRPRRPQADAAGLPREVSPEPRQPRQQMLELRQLDLQLAFASAGAPGEDVEDQRRAVEDLAVEDAFEITALRG